MSAYKKLAAKDIFFTSHLARKSWKLEGNSNSVKLSTNNDLDEARIVIYRGEGDELCGNFTLTKENAVYESIKHLYYSNYLSTTPSGSYDNFIENYSPVNQRHLKDEKMVVASVDRRTSGLGIEPGTLKIVYDDEGTEIVVGEDRYSDGGLYAVDPLTNAYLYVGNIIYNHGMIIYNFLKRYVNEFEQQNTVVVEHNLNERDLIIECYERTTEDGCDFFYRQITPYEIDITDQNKVKVIIDPDETRLLDFMVVIFPSTQEEIISEGVTTISLNEPPDRKSKIIVKVYDEEGIKIQPSNITIVNTDTVRITIEDEGNYIAKIAVANNNDFFRTTEVYEDSSYIITHNLDAEDVFVQVINNDGEIITPAIVKLLNYDQVYISFGETTFEGTVSILDTQNKIYNISDEEVLNNTTFNFKSKQPIYTLNANCKVLSHELSHTSNVTSMSSSLEEGEIDKSGGEYFDKEITPYVSSVGLYNESNELLAVAKLAKPLLKPDSTDTTFVIKLDM